jgi:hypothetical protein
VPVQASTIYNLVGDWSNTNNPNGTWRYLQGTNLLSFQAAFTGCFNGVPGLGGGWAPGNVSGNCVPAFFKATGNATNPSDWLTGDVVVHSVDPGSGNPANGQAIVSWTAPVAGTISYSGSIWYAHSGVQRSNDFLLTDGSTTLASGTVAFNSIVGNSRSNPDLFSGGALAVNAGDVIALMVSRSAGQTFGSLDGITLTITETSFVPEPATALLFLAAAACVPLFRRRTCR